MRRLSTGFEDDARQLMEVLFRRVKVGICFGKQTARCLRVFGRFADTQPAIGLAFTPRSRDCSLCNVASTEGHGII